MNPGSGTARPRFVRAARRRRDSQPGRLRYAVHRERVRAWLGERLEDGGRLSPNRFMVPMRSRKRKEAFPENLSCPLPQCHKIPFFCSAFSQPFRRADYGLRLFRGAVKRASG